MAFHLNTQSRSRHLPGRSLHRFSTRTRPPVLAAIGVLLLAGCGSGTPTAGPVPSTTTVVGTPSSTAPAKAVPAGALTVAVEPLDGYRTVDRLIAGATRSVDMTMYELSDPTVQGLLVADHRRGVAVRVLLDRAFAGSAANGGAMAELTASGVPVRWAIGSTIVHQKTVTVDAAATAVMTGNLTSEFEATTRDFVVIDRDAAAVADVETVFADDWNGGAVTSAPDVDGLVWSPGALTSVVGVVDHATRSLLVENEEMADPSVVAALESASRRGVAVTLIMTDATEWHPVFAALGSAGVHVVTYPDTSEVLYIHAKAIVADGTTAFVGSQNFSRTSLDRNRELGLITNDPSAVMAVARALDADAGGATPFATTGTPGSTPPSAPAIASSPATVPGTAGVAATSGGCFLDPEGKCYRPSEYCPSSLHGKTVAGASGSITCTDTNGWRWETGG